VNCVLLNPQLTSLLTGEQTHTDRQRDRETETHTETHTQTDIIIVKLHRQCKYVNDVSK